MIERAGAREKERERSAFGKWIIFKFQNITIFYLHKHTATTKAIYKSFKLLSGARLSVDWEASASEQEEL